MRLARVVTALVGVGALLGTAPPAFSGPSPSPLDLGDVLCTVDQLLGSPLRVPCPAAPATAPTKGEEARPSAVAQQSRRDALAPDLITAKFVGTATRADVAELLDSVDATVVHTIPELDVSELRVEPPRLQDVLAELQRSELVARVEQERVVPLIDLTANDTVDGDWGTRLIHAQEAWDVTRGSSAITVAVLDTGVDPTHPDLRGSFVAGFDLIDGDAVPDDPHGHGTAVAGIIGARVGRSGLCPACSLMSVRVMDANGLGTTSTIAAGIVRAVDAGARVLNLSVGSTGTTETLAEAVRYALDRDAVVVAAAGNDGRDDALYPAAYPGVIGVAGTDEGDRLYSWSNRGPKVLLAAPGCNTAPLLRTGRAYFCGTSSATPVVAGIVALARSANAASTRAEIAAALERTSVRVQGVRSGRVDAARTLAAFAPQRVRLTTSSRVTAGRPVSHGFDTGAGRVTALVTGPRASTLTLELLDAAGKRIGAVRGRASLRLERMLAAGSYTLRVSGRRSTSYHLVLEYVRPR